MLRYQLRHPFPTAMLVAGCLASASTAATGEESPWQKYFSHVASAYTISVGGDATRELHMRERPVMKWSQPVRGGDDGAIFLWLDNQRPAAIGAIFIWPDASRGKGLSHEFQSLSEQPLKAVWKDRTWTPPRNSTRWQPVPNAAPPPTTARQRDLALRQLARRFTASSRSREGERWHLRLLPRPIHRHEDDSGESLRSGALFGFVQGTDLEVVLLLESQATASGPQWHFACARMSDYQLVVKWDGKSVWSADFAPVDDFDGAYCGSIVEYLREPPSVELPDAKSDS